MHLFGGWNSFMGQQSGGPGVNVSVTPMPGGVGGFPGMYPGAGPGQSQMIGLEELKRRQQAIPLRRQEFTYGPPLAFMSGSWRR